MNPILEQAEQPGEAVQPVGMAGGPADGAPPAEPEEGRGVQPRGNAEPPEPALQPGAGGAAVVPSVMPGTQHPAPNPMTYEAWSAANFALTQIMVWAGLVGPLATSLLQHLGFEPSDHARCVASSPLSELMEALADWTFNGRAMSFAIKAKLTTFYHGCRYACGLSEPILQPPQQYITQHFAGPSSPTPPAPAKDADDKVEVNDVINQGGVRS